jgi:hypothetical protein
MSLMGIKWQTSVRARCAVLIGFTVATISFLALHTAEADPTECVGMGYLTWRPAGETGHILSTIDTDTGDLDTIAALPYRINAIGYSNDQRRLFGLARPADDTHRSDGPHLVSLNADGDPHDHGRLHGTGADSPGLAGAYAGTVREDQLIVLTGQQIVAVDIAAENGWGRSTVLSTLDVPAAELGIGDIVVNPDDGKLLGLSTHQSSVVVIDPGSGDIESHPVSGLPDRSLAGAVFIDERHRLYAAVNGIDGEAVLYRVTIPPDGYAGLRATETARWPAVASADGAYCPAKPAATPSASHSRASAPPPAIKPDPVFSEPPASPASQPAPPASPASQPVSPAERPRTTIAEKPVAAMPAPPEPEEAPRRWIAVGAVVIGMAGAAGVKAAANRKK